MKQIAPNYSYNKTTGVITLTGVNIDRDQLLLIVNTTRNVTYYNFADSATTLQAFTKGASTSFTLNSAVITASSTHANTDALVVYYDDQIDGLNVFNNGGDSLKTDLSSVRGSDAASWLQDGGGNVPIGQQSDDSDAGIKFVPIGWALTDSNAQLDQWKAVTQYTPLPISGTVTAIAGGETPTSGTATLTNDTRWELNTEGFGHIAIEVVSSGVTWSSNGVSAQAYNGTAPGNADILAPAGIRYRHSSDTSVAPLTALNNIYYNLGIGPTVGNGYGTNLVRVDGSNTTSLALPTTGTRYFLFDLTTSRFALRPFFSAGTVTVKYRLYKEKHPFFSARNIVATGEGTAGAVRVDGSVSLAGGNVYLDGGYLDDTSSIENAAYNALDNWGSNLTNISVSNQGAIGTFNNTLVNAGTIFSYSAAGNYGLFDAGTDADYVEFRVNGGGGGFVHNIALSVGNSPFTTGAGTASGTVVVFNEKYPSNHGDTTAYRFSNTILNSGSGGSFVFGLWAGTVKYRYVRIEVAGGGGGSWAGVFNSYRSSGLAPINSFGVDRILNRVPIAGVVDINSCTSSLPCTVSGTVNTYPQQGATPTNSNFTSTTSATLVAAVSGREVLTVFNEGAGTLFINVGSSASTTSYQVRLQSGDYWEAPAGQLSLQHSAIFGSAGTARVTQVS